MDKKEVSHGQFLGVAITIIIALLTSWVTMNQRLKSLEVGAEIRLKHLERQVIINQGYYLEILEEIKDVNVKLENKQNRP